MQIDFPAGRIFAKANNVIRVERTSEVDGNPTLEIGGMLFKRYFKDLDSDVVYFPLDGILEAMIGDGKELLFDSGDIVISYILDGDPTNDGNPAQIKVVNGASDTLFSSAPSVDGYGFPQPKKIRIHTSIFPHSVPTATQSIDSYLCVVGVHYTFFSIQEMEDFFSGIAPTSNKFCYVTDEVDFFEMIYTSRWTWVDLFKENPNAVILSSQSIGNEAEITSEMFANLQENEVNKLAIKENLLSDEFHLLDYVIDDCTDGILVRWFDIYGYTLMFRFKRNDSSDVVKTEKTINYVTSDLKERKNRQRTWVRALTLTSGLVDKDTFDWLGRIPLGRNVQIFDTGTGGWIDCNCEDVTISGQNEMNAVNIVLSIDKLTPTM